MNLGIAPQLQSLLERQVSFYFRYIAYKHSTFVFMAMSIFSTSCLICWCVRCCIWRRRHRYAFTPSQDPEITSTSPDNDQVPEIATQEGFASEAANKLNAKTKKKLEKSTEKGKDNSHVYYNPTAENVQITLEPDNPPPPIAEDEEIVYCRCKDEDACNGNCREHYLNIISNFFGYNVRNTQMENYILDPKHTAAHGFPKAPYLRKRKNKKNL